MKTFIHVSINTSALETKKMLEAQNLKKLHTSLARGYVSRKCPGGYIEKYKGRFGEGYKLLTPNYTSTRYCFVTYFIKD